MLSRTVSIAFDMRSVLLWLQVCALTSLFFLYYFYEVRSLTFCADFVPMGYIEPEDVVSELSSADSIGLLADVVEAPFGF